MLYMTNFVEKNFLFITHKLAFPHKLTKTSINSIIIEGLSNLSDHFIV